jgi:hypothetical protein
MAACLGDCCQWAVWQHRWGSGLLSVSALSTARPSGAAAVHEYQTSTLHVSISLPVWAAVVLRSRNTHVGMSLRHRYPPTQTHVCKQTQWAHIEHRATTSLKLYKGRKTESFLAVLRSRHPIGHMLLLLMLPTCSCSASARSHCHQRPPIAPGPWGWG